MNVIPRPVHAFIDYAYVHVVAASPEVFNFGNKKNAVVTARLLSLGVLVTSLLTRYEGGLIRVIPFRNHLRLDFAASVFSLAAPWLFGFNKNNKARNTFLMVGLAGLAVAGLTQDEEMRKAELVK